MTSNPILVLAACALAGVARDAVAQGEDGKANKGKAKIEIELPAEKPRDLVPRTPADLVEALLPALSKYPSLETRRAMEQLVLSGSEVAPALRTVLNGSTFLPRVPAALVLADLGDADAVPGIERLLSDPRALRHGMALLEAIEKLDPARARSLAVELASGKNARLGSLALRYLRTRNGPELRPAIESLFSARHARVREEAFDLLKALDGVDLTDVALDLLSDRSGRLCKAACDWLVSHRDEHTVARLRGLRDGDPRSRHGLWALIALAEIQEAYGEPVLEEELRLELQPALLARDPLERLAAALALAEIGFASERDDAESLLSERVLPAIMETFLKNQYFPDLLPLLELSRTRVRRITGLDLGTDLSRWRAAWTGAGDTPLVRRDLPPEKLLEVAGELVIRYQRRGLPSRGPDVERILAGDGLLSEGEPPGAPEGAIFLDPIEMRTLVAQFMEAGAFGRGRKVAIDDTSRGFRAIRITWSNRERSIVASDREDPDFDRVESLLVDAVDRGWWQKLYLGNPAEIGSFYRRERARFGADASEEDRARALLHLIQIALPSLDADDRRETLAMLLRRKELLDHIDEEALPNLLGALDREPDPEGPAEVLAEIVRQMGRPELAALTRSYLADRFGEQAVRLIRTLIAEEDAFFDCVGDGRAVVRLAAVEEAARLEGVEDELVRIAEADPDPRVRRAAVFALAASSDPEARSRVRQYAAGGSPVLQNVAIEALGSSDDEESLDLLLDTLTSGEGAARRAAMVGLAARGGPMALSALRALALGDDVDSTTRQDAVAAIGMSEDENAPDALFELMASERIEVREEAACQLAVRRDMRAAPVLIELLDEPLRAPRCLDFLALLFCQDGGARGEQFVLSYNNEPYVDHDEWFARALSAGGAAGDAVDPMAVDTLLSALSDDRWFVRSNALSRLERTFGVRLGALSRFATNEDYQRVAERWRRHVAVRPLLDRARGRIGETVDESG